MMFEALPVASTLHWTASGLVASARVAATAPVTVSLPPLDAAGAAVVAVVAAEGAAAEAGADVAWVAVAADVPVEGAVDPPDVDADLLELEHPETARTLAAAHIASRRRRVGEVMTDSGEAEGRVRMGARGKAYSAHITVGLQWPVGKREVSWQAQRSRLLIL